MISRKCLSGRLRQVLDTSLPLFIYIFIIILMMLSLYDLFLIPAGTITIAVFTTASPQNSVTSSAFSTATVPASTSLTSPPLTTIATASVSFSASLPNTEATSPGSFSASPRNTEASASTSLSASPLNTEASPPESLSASPLSTRASPIVTSKASTKTPTAMMTPATSAGSAAVYSVHSSPSSSFNPPPSKSSLIPIGTPMPPRIVYPIITAVTFKMNWGDLCPLLTLFKERLSHHLLEYKGYKDTEYYHVPTDRIILINRDQNCNVKLSYDEEAIVEFYITNNSTVDPVRMAQDETNTNLTRKAYKILYDYWVNHLMVLLHDVFIKQVSGLRGRTCELRRIMRNFISYLVLDYINAIFYSRFLIIKDHFNRNCMSTHFRAVL